jgi:hypothetical protein
MAFEDLTLVPSQTKMIKSKKQFQLCKCLAQNIIWHIITSGLGVCVLCRLGGATFMSFEDLTLVPIHAV